MVPTKKVPSFANESRVTGHDACKPGKPVISIDVFKGKFLKGSGLRVEGSGFGVQGLRCRA